MTEPDPMTQLKTGVDALAQATEVAAAARGMRDAAIRALRANGTSVLDLMQSTGLSDSAVRKICDVA